MVVISTAIMSKDEILVSRQFVDITRARIENLLTSFLRLVETGNKDHTYLQTDYVQYVYLPIDTLYLVLVTNKQSNVLEDLETLKLMQQVVQGYCKPLISKETVLENAFLIIFALDEMISAGYRESVNLGQIKMYLEMESQDEKRSVMIQEEKIKEERRRGQEIANRLEKERREREKKKSLVKEASKSFTKTTLDSSTWSEMPPLPLSESIVSLETVSPSPVAPTIGLPPTKGMKLGKPKKNLRLISA